MKNRALHAFKAWQHITQKAVNKALILGFKYEICDLALQIGCRGVQRGPTKAAPG